MCFDKIRFFLFLFFLVYPDVCGAAAQYPLPVSETEKVVTDWFRSQNFEIERSELEMSVIKLTTKRAKEVYTLRLTPDSPLATAVAIDMRGKRGNNDIPQQLQRYLGGYVNMISTPSKMPLSEIPTAVLSRKQSVVCIHVAAGEREVQLTGFVVDRSGLILCTAHDLKRIRRISVSLGDDRQLNARIIKMDRKRDLILLHVNRNFSNFIPLSKSRNGIHAGEKLFALGCSHHEESPVQAGVAGPLRRVEDLPIRQVSMNIFSGSSGSPVVDKKGRLVGVVKGRFRGVNSVGFLIPADTIIAFLKDRVFDRHLGIQEKKGRDPARTRP